MSVVDLAIDVGLAKDSDEYTVFVSCVNNILELGNRYSKETTEDIIDKCKKSKLDIATEVIEACTYEKTSSVRRSKLKWWESYVPRRERISRDIEIDRRPTRAPRRSESRRHRQSRANSSVSPMSERRQHHKKRPMSPMFEGRQQHKKRPMSPMFERRQQHKPAFDRRHQHKPAFDRRQHRRKRPMSPMFDRQQQRKKRPMSPMFERPDSSPSPVYRREEPRSSVPRWKRRKVN